MQVVSGLEPGNTNAFLQMLARAALLSDGAAAVQRVLKSQDNKAQLTGSSANAQPSTPQAG